MAAHARGDKLGNTLFSSLLNSDLPPEELSPKRLHQEAISIIGAGIETTARSLTVACFHIIDQPAIRDRLFAELSVAIPDPAEMLNWDTLAKLPFLSACVEETLRLTYGASHRMQRAYPQGTLVRVMKGMIQFRATNHSTGLQRLCDTTRCDGLNG